MKAATMAPITARDIAENAVITLVARVAMILAIPVLTIFGWVGQTYYNSQQAAFSAMSDRFDTYVKSVNDHVDSLNKAANIRIDGLDKLTNDLGTRITVIETHSSTSANIDTAFRSQVSSDLRDVRASVQQMATQVAGLNATLQQMKDDRRPSGGGPLN